MEKSGLVSFAEDEFKILGWDKSDDEMQKEICKDLIVINFKIKIRFFTG